MSTNWWKDKENMVYPCDGILYSHKEEWSTDTHYDMDEPWKLCFMKKASTEGLHVVWFLLYEMCRIGKSVQRENRFMVA